MGAFDATTSVTDGVTDNLAQYHNELKTAADHTMSAAAYAAYGTPASMTGNVTLTDASLPILSYAPTAARDLTLPAVATTNHAFYVINRSGTYAITVKDAAAATITTVAVNSTAFLVSDGANNWYPMGGGLTKAAAADVATGTDDAKYVTAKSIKDSVNVPNVSPVGGTGNVLTSNGTAWTSATPPATAHIAASANVHGLPASVNVLGNRSAAGEFVQRAGGLSLSAVGGTPSFYLATTTGFTFPVAYSAAPAVWLGGTTENKMMNASAYAITTTGFNVIHISQNNGESITTSSRWVALGA